MRKLVAGILIFCIPYLAWAALVVIIDPFNYFGVSHVVPGGIKRNTAYELDPGLWKALEFRKRPVANLVLGDSRANRLSARRIRELTGREFYNFAVPGATLPEIIEVFRYARRFVTPSAVYLGISFDLYNGVSGRRTFFRSEAISDNMLHYLFDRTVATALYCNLRALLVDREYRVGRPNLGKDAFWSYQLTYSAASMYQSYSYPADYYRLLKEMAEYCAAHSIQLVLFIPPTHVDLQRRVAEFGLTAEEQRFKEDLASLACVHDLNVSSELTRSRENFRDPYHIVTAVQDQVIREVWGSTGCQPSRPARRDR